MPVLGALGSPMHVGPLGAGTAAKLVANSTLFGVLAVLGEALALADGLDLPHDVAFEVLSATPVGAQADRRRPAVESVNSRCGSRCHSPGRTSIWSCRPPSRQMSNCRSRRPSRQWVVAAQEAGLGDRDYSAVLAQSPTLPGQPEPRPCGRPVRWPLNSFPTPQPRRDATFPGGAGYARTRSCAGRRIAYLAIKVTAGVSPPPDTAAAPGGAPPRRGI